MFYTERDAYLFGGIKGVHLPHRGYIFDELCLIMIRFNRGKGIS